MTTTTTAPAPRAEQSRGQNVRTMLRTAGPSLLVDAALPYLVYVLLSGSGMSDVAALAWSAVPPALNVAWQALRSRKLNPIGAIVLVTIVIGVGTSLLSGDPRFAVARDALGSIVVGLVLLGSLLFARRPLLFHVIKASARMQRPELPALMDAQWESNPRFRRTVRNATLVGLVATLGEAALRVTLAYTIPVAVAVPLLSVQSIVVWVGLSILLVASIKKAVRSARA